jgi:hypothetical protein
MDEGAALGTRAWESFYVIVGSSAGALTGLQFVVLTMIAEARRARGGGGGGESIAAFGSPTVVHFCAALLMAAILSAPWGDLAPPGIAIAVCGACGVIYSGIVLRRTLRQNDYKPVLEDWIWHAALPLLAYAALVQGGWGLEHHSADTLYVVGAATLLLVFIGIHNAWDAVMYITVVGLPEHAPVASREVPAAGAHAGGGSAAEADTAPAVAPPAKPGAARSKRG